MSMRLIRSRRFSPMFGAMALGAFNDNFYKNALIVLITYRLAAESGHDAAALISIASASFTAPFFLFSSLAGDIADKWSKSYWVRVLKIVEMVLYAAAGLALLNQHLYAMMIALFLLGTLASFYGPVKYAILPELLPRDQLLRATSYIEGGTYVSILLGSLLGAVLVMLDQGALLVSGVMGLIGALGILCAWFVPRTEPAQPQLVLRYNLIKSIWSMITTAGRSRIILSAILGISWFWTIGAMYLTQLPIFTKEVVGANERVVSLYTAIFTISIALGSIACARLAERVRPDVLSPLALFGVFLTGIDLCITGYFMPTPATETLIGLEDYFHGFAHWRIMADLAVMAFCGGLFIVPLYTVLQTDSAEGERARIIASNNVVNAIFIAGSQLVAAGLYALGLNVINVLLVFALLNLPFCYRLWRQRIG